MIGQSLHKSDKKSPDFLLYFYFFFATSFDFQPCYMHAVKLLSSLSGFQVTRKAWRKEAFDLFLNPSFFVVEFEALREWKVVIDNLMTQDQVTFRDLLTRLNSSAATGVVNIFSSLEQVRGIERRGEAFFQEFFSG